MSTFDSEIELGNKKEKVEMGDVTYEIEWSSVLANLLDDNRSEFYQAASAGLKPELTFEINDFEYESEEFVRYNDKTYTVIRAAKRGEMRELVVTSHVGSEV